ncbi:hypothetical protein [Noviherbaspirillum pedocola]|uniref:Uncharacterized protein n=1 Tax=Noviherbaspirillum pedocola TaxID=2801341 RepID=A0A934WA55_9BURK|nr:hypothetical protein [Noviherbaspirillum pedocola]MBK4739228.1 hypothetical protein [Noviherbaspirillum pedocola]
MTSPTEEEARLKEVDQQLRELEWRLEELGRLMVDMVAPGRSTTNQSELYYQLLRTIKQL